MLGDTNACGEAITTITPVWYTSRVEPTQYFSALKCGNIVHISGALNFKVQGNNLTMISSGLPPCHDFQTGFIFDQNDNFKVIGYFTPLDSGGCLYTVTQTTGSGLVDIMYFTR